MVAPPLISVEGKEFLFSYSSLTGKKYIVEVGQGGGAIAHLLKRKGMMPPLPLSKERGLLFSVKGKEYIVQVQRGAATTLIPSEGKLVAPLLIPLDEKELLFSDSL